jgi:hypothetical protein
MFQSDSFLGHFSAVGPWAGDCTPEPSFLICKAGVLTCPAGREHGLAGGGPLLLPLRPSHMSWVMHRWSEIACSVVCVP